MFGVRSRAARLAGAAALCAASIAAVRVPFAADAASTAAPLAPHRPGRVLVGFEPGVGSAQAAAAVRAAGAVDLKRTAFGAHLLGVRPGTEAKTVRALERGPAVRYAEPDYLVTSLAVPNDPDFPHQWALRNTGQTVNGEAGTPGDDIDITPVWDTITDASSNVIGLVDDGIDVSLPDLAANAWSNPGVLGCAPGTHGYDVPSGACAPGTLGIHGTAMMSLFETGNNGQGASGVPWRSSIMAVTTGRTTDVATYALGVSWVVRAKQGGVNVRLLNASWGWTSYSQAMADALTAAGDNGILVVAGAGNKATDNDTSPFYPCNYGLANEVCVAAVDQNFNLWYINNVVTQAGSNYGANSVDLAAPGANICLDAPSTSCLYNAGTSEATAIVTGAASLLLAHAPTMSTADLKAAILNNVRPVAALSGKVRTGGVLDVYCAMTNCRNVIPPPPSTTTTQPGSTSSTSTSTSTTSTTAPGGGKPVTRLAGADRVATAVAISHRAFPAALSAAGAVLARADAFADALAGAPLAVARRGPLLLTGSAALDDRVAAELVRVLSEGRTVYLLGGPNALDPAVEAQVRALGYPTVRYAGADRYATAAAVANQGLGNPATLLEATGLDFPDALAAGAAAARAHGAVLLTAGATMPTATAAYLAAHPGAARYTLGWPAHAADPAATAVAGADRYETAADAARVFFSAPQLVGVASGESFPDALGGGAHAGLLAAPLLLVPSTGALPPSVQDYLRANSTAITAAYVYGGLVAVGADVAGEVQAAISAP
jgi:putative cell wall-binding protein